MNASRILQLQRFLSLSQRFSDDGQMWVIGGEMLTWGDLRILVSEAVENASEELGYQMPVPDSITCPVCTRVSYNTQDIINGYCGYCHDWTAGEASSEKFYGERRATSEADFYGD